MPFLAVRICCEAQDAELTAGRWLRGQPRQYPAFG
jgi:hypothetical protein